MRHLAIALPMSVAIPLFAQADWSVRRADDFERGDGLADLVFLIVKSDLFQLN